MITQRRSRSARVTRASCSLAMALGAALLVGCGPADDELRLAQVASGIADGYDDPDDTAVMAVLQPGSGLLCSGTLIAPNVVLTAGHCVAPTSGDEGGVLCDSTKLGGSAAPGAFFVTRAAEVTLANAGEFYVQQVLRVPGDDPLFCGNDAALLILKDLVPSASALPIEPRVAAPLTPGDLFSAVGYGGTDNNGNDSGVRRRRDDLQVMCVGEVCDSPQVLPAEWVGDGGVCRGDSGGPALDMDGRVAGVASRGSAACDQSLYSDTFAWGDWLKDSVVYASGVGVYDAPAWTAGSSVNPEHSMPIGDSCAGPTDCPSGRCIQDATGSYCTRICDVEHACPDGYLCELRNELEQCVAIPPPPPFKRAPEDGDCSLVQAHGQPASPWLLLWALPLLWRRAALGNTLSRKPRRGAAARR